MKLSDLTGYEAVTIQCHDHPDADALGAGYGLYCFFKSRGKKVSLIYSGPSRIQKTNLRLMLEKLSLPVEYRPDREERLEGLLITVDCQYGAGNVSRFEADAVAVIDHHQMEMENLQQYRIQPSLGSCCTLVWSMLREEGYPVNGDIVLGTALYYGLYSDTNQFSELFNPLDLDMRETLPFQKGLITMFRNSNLTLQELEIAGIALVHYHYNKDYRFAIIQAQPCDPNILGLISDFLLQVDGVDTCMVYNEGNDGFKLSVRSCIREVNASELAAFLTKGIGSGGGRYEKAGGFISSRLYREQNPTLYPEGYFNNRMEAYFDYFTIIAAGKAQPDMSGMKLYARRKEPMGYVCLTEILEPGAQVTVRTQEGDRSISLEEELYFVLEPDGGVRPYRKDAFNRCFDCADWDFPAEKFRSRAEYAPTVKNWMDGSTLILAEYAKVCVPSDRMRVYAACLDRGVKVFPQWDAERYLVGHPGDYLAVGCEDPHDIFVVDREAFGENYVEIPLF